MKFRVARDEFAESVTWVARSLPSRPPVPVLGCVVLTAGDIEPGRDGLTVSGFDYEVSAEETISAEVAEPGRVLVSGRLLADITKALPHKPVDVSLDGSRVAISCGSAKFSLPTMPVEDYPEMPKVPDVTGSLPAGIFAEAITQVAVAAGRDDTLPMLTGVRLEIEGNIVVLAATDRFRLAVRELGGSPPRPASPVPCWFPPNALRQCQDGRFRGQRRAGVRIRRQCGFRGHPRYPRSEQTHHHPPARRRVPQVPPAPAGQPHRDRHHRGGPADRSHQTCGLVAERGAQVRLGSASVRCCSPPAATRRARPRVPRVNFHGEPLTIAFNPGYLLDGLSAIGSPSVDFGFTTPSRPAVLRPSSGEAGGRQSGAFVAPDSVFTLPADAGSPPG